MDELDKATDSALGRDMLVKLEFATRLRIARKVAGLTQTLLAKKIGMTQSGYTNYENAIREPTLLTLKSLSQALDVSVDWLLGLKGRGLIDNCAVPKRMTVEIGGKQWTNWTKRPIQL